MDHGKPSFLKQASPFASAREIALRYVSAIRRAAEVQNRINAKRTIMVGPGRVTLYTMHRKIAKGLHNGKKYNRLKGHKSGGYLHAGYASDAIERLSRWMAAHPEAKNNKGAPRHIVRNAAQAMQFGKED